MPLVYVVEILKSAALAGMEVATDAFSIQRLWLGQDWIPPVSSPLINLTPAYRTQQATWTRA